VAGTVFVGAEERWTAASWLFDWVVSTVAELVEDPAVAQRLTEIVSENLGALDLSSFDQPQQMKIRLTMGQHLLDRAEQGFPQDLAARSDVLAHLAARVELTRTG
jgi:hypothetical protein